MSRNVEYLVKGLDLIGRKEPPVAMCPRCPDEPLAFTFEMTGYEFTCIACDGWFGFLDPRPETTTLELQARVDAVKAAYQAQREERRRASAHPYPDGLVR